MRTSVRSIGTREPSPAVKLATCVVQVPAVRFSDRPQLTCCGYRVGVQVFPDCSAAPTCAGAFNAVASGDRRRRGQRSGVWGCWGIGNGFRVVCAALRPPAESYIVSLFVHGDHDVVSRYASGYGSALRIGALRICLFGHVRSASVDDGLKLGRIRSTVQRQIRCSIYL